MLPDKVSIREGRCLWSQLGEPSAAAKEPTGWKVLGECAGVRMCVSVCVSSDLCTLHSHEKGAVGGASHPSVQGLKCLHVTRGWISLQVRNGPEATETLCLAGGSHSPDGFFLRWQHWGYGISPFSLDYSLTAVLRTVNPRRTARSRPPLWGCRSKPGNESLKDQAGGDKRGRAGRPANRDWNPVPPWSIKRDPYRRVLGVFWGQGSG